MPKSRTFTKSFRSRRSRIITFWGFTSRWMIPTSWASARLRSTWMAMRATRASGSRPPPERRTSWRLSPLRYSMAR